MIVRQSEVNICLYAGCCVYDNRAELKRKEKNGSMKRCLNKLVPKILIIAEAL